MPQTATRFAMRTTAPAAGQDWCRFSNKKNGDKTVDQVYIYDEIGYWGTTASDFVEKLNALEGDELEVHINSPGGDVFDGVAIHSALKAQAKKKPVIVIIDALAASAASFIAQAGSEVRMARNATMMIHDASSMAYGTAATLEKQAKILNQVSDNIADIYSQSNDTPAEDWRALMKEEVWYSGPEAVTAGLATSVIDQEDEEAEAAKANWDLSIFNHAGRDKAPSPLRVAQRLKLTNHSKEKPVSGTTATPKASETAGTNGDGQPVTEGEGNLDPATTSPDTSGSTDGAPPVTPAEDANAEQNGAPDGAGTPQPTPEQAGETTNVANAAGLVPVVVNGATFTVPAPVAQQMNVLQASVNESVVAGKKAFVKSLADGKKITAPQVPGLEAYALGLDGPQYDAWKATWDLAPASPVLAQHGGTSSSTSAGAASPSAQRKADLEEIVANLGRSLTKEQLEKTPSWIELQNINNANQA